MSLKYKDGDLLINKRSGCLLVIKDVEKEICTWLTTNMDDTFYVSITRNKHDLFNDSGYGEDFELLGNICTLSKNIQEEIRNGSTE